MVDSGPLYDKRTGPIIAIAAGPLSQSEAKALLASVSYEADVTWNENTTVTKKDNLANLLVNIILLCGILIGFALIAGVAFGGLRIILRKFSRQNFRDTDEVEFISLHLGEGRSEAAVLQVSQSIDSLYRRLNHDCAGNGKSNALLTHFVKH